MGLPPDILSIPERGEDEWDLRASALAIARRHFGVSAELEITSIEVGSDFCSSFGTVTVRRGKAMSNRYVLGMSSHTREVDHAAAWPIPGGQEPGMPWKNATTVCSTRVVVMDYGSGPVPWIPTTTAFCETCRLLTGMGPQA